jgi:hypothetical protein
LNGTGCVINLFWAGLNMHAVDVFTLNGIERDHVASLTVRLFIYSFPFSCAKIALSEALPTL